MQQKSLGLIETQGLAAGIEAADAAVKSANVQLVGYELTKGGGWTTVKIQGDVGAVKAAVDAAKMAASKVNRVVSTRVIPRPSAYLEMLIHTSETVGWHEEPPKGPEPPEGPEPPKGPESPVPPAESEAAEKAPEEPEAEEPPQPEAPREEQPSQPEAPEEEPAVPEPSPEEPAVQEPPKAEEPAEPPKEEMPEPVTPEPPKAETPVEQPVTPEPPQAETPAEQSAPPEAPRTETPPEEPRPVQISLPEESKKPLGKRRTGRKSPKRREPPKASDGSGEAN